MTQNSTRLDIYWDAQDADSLIIQYVLVNFLDAIPSAQIHGISGTPQGMNITGTAPRAVIKGLLAAQGFLGIRVIDHASREAV